MHDKINSNFDVSREASGDLLDKLLPSREAMQACIRCGMCLPHCPTYTTLKVERASPRGRAALIRMAADGKIAWNRTVSEQMYLCLDCRACETACPAGVRIGHLIEAARAHAEQKDPSSWPVRLFRRFLFGWLFMRHWRLEWATLPLRLYQKSGLQKRMRALGLLRWLPRPLRFMEALAPADLKKPFRKTIPERLPALGVEYARVGYFLGCMMSLLFNRTTTATVEILRRSGCTVITPKAIRCCGAPLFSEGFKPKAVELVKFNIDLFEKYSVDTIVTDCAACAAALKEYEEILEHDPAWRDKARRFSQKAREITEFLADWPHFHGPALPTPACGCTPGENCAPKKRVTYDAPCHLCHAQQVWDPPVRLIKQIPDIEYVPLQESDWCCGSAGLYNITHPDMSEKILNRKMNHIAATGADVVLTANPGCLMQLDYGVRARGLPITVQHVVEFLNENYTNTGEKNDIKSK